MLECVACYLGPKGLEFSVGVRGLLSWTERSGVQCWSAWLAILDREVWSSVLECVACYLGPKGLEFSVGVRGLLSWTERSGVQCWSAWLAILDRKDWTHSDGACNCSAHTCIQFIQPPLFDQENADWVLTLMMG